MMNKEFWERIDRMEELTEKTTRPDWDIHVKGDNAYATNVDFLQADNLRYIAAVNPAMILDMIEEMRKLKKEADWLALALSKRGNTEIFCCPKNEPYKPIIKRVAEHGSCANCWRKAARKAVSEADNA